MRAVVEWWSNIVATFLKVSQSVEIAASDHVAIVEGDIGSSATADRTAETALAQFPSIDGLISNAGIFFVKPFMDYTAEDAKWLMNILAQLCSNVMSRRSIDTRSGSAILCSSASVA